MPYGFGTAMLPFVALLIAGTADAYWRAAEQTSDHRRRGLDRVISLGVRTAGKIPVVAATLVLAVICVPHWYRWPEQQSTYNRFAQGEAAGSSVAEHLPRDGLGVCDPYPWL